METRAIYFKRRAAEQRSAAASASSLIARSCHLELADAYDFRGREFAALDSRSESEPSQEPQLIAVSPI
jgi:hypothetical protein